MRWSITITIFAAGELKVIKSKRSNCHNYSTHTCQAMTYHNTRQVIVITLRAIVNLKEIFYLSNMFLRFILFSDYGCLIRAIGDNVTDVLFPPPLVIQIDRFLVNIFMLNNFYIGAFSKV